MIVEVIRSLDSAKKRGYQNKEVFHLCRYWLPIWTGLADAYTTPGNLDMNQELRSGQISDESGGLRADLGLVLDFGEQEKSVFPLLLGELGRQPMRNDPLVVHKDKSKLTVMMGMAMLKMMQLLQNEPLEELNKLRMFGELIGAFESEFLVMQPVITSKNGPSWEFVFILHSSPDWRLSLLLEAGADEPRSPEVGDSVCDLHNAVLEDNFVGVAPPANTALIDITRSEEQLCKRLHDLGRVNFVNLKCHAQFFRLVDDMASFIKRKIGSAIPANPQLRNFRYSPDLQPIKGLSCHLFPNRSRSPSRSSSGSPIQASPLRQFHEANLNLKLIIDPSYDTINIRKCESYEVAVYTLPDVQQSLFFPKFVSCARVDGKNIVEMTLERILPIDEYLRDIPFEVENQDCLYNMQILMARCFLNGICALRELHQAGFVHGDVSPRNIGFNKRLQLFQLFDFNQSRPLEQARNEKFFGGTHPFISPSYEDYGYFYPADDYYALNLSIQECFFDKIEFETFRTMTRPFIHLDWLIKSRVNREDTDTKHEPIFKEAVDLYTKIFLQKHSQVELDADPSYLAIQAEELPLTPMDSQ